MKILGLSFLLLCLIATSAAQSLSDPQKSDQITTQDSRSSGTLLLPDLTRDRASWNESTTSYCAYMRTYRMKRKSRGSDVVSPASYTKCVPTARFELRSTVQIQTEPAARE
jgi:hypothetical protein